MKMHLNIPIPSHAVNISLLSELNTTRRGVPFFWSLSLMYPLKQLQVRAVITYLS